MVNLMLSFAKFSNFQLVFKIKYMVWVEFVHNRQIDSYNYLSTEDIHSKTLLFYFSYNIYNYESLDYILMFTFE